MCCRHVDRGVEKRARAPPSLQTSAMARNLLNSQPVCSALFLCQYCFAALTRQEVHSLCNPAFYLLQNSFILKCECPNHILYSGGNTRVFVYLHQCFPTSSREIVSCLRHLLLFCEWLKIYLFFNCLLHVLAHSTFDKSGRNPMHVCLYTIAIFADQHCLLFVTAKNLCSVFFTYSGLECFPRRFISCLEYVPGIVFYTFDLDIFKAPSTYKSFSF